MFGELGQMAGLLGKLPKIKQEVANLEKRIGEITAEGTSGGGMVTAKVNGKFALLSVRIADETIKAGDKEMLEDLIAAAVNQANEKVRQQVAAETQKMAADLGLPPGLGLPGLM